METSAEYRRSFRKWEREQPLRPTQPVAFDAQKEAENIMRAQRERALRRLLRGRDS